MFEKQFWGKTQQKWPKEVDLRSKERSGGGLKCEQKEADQHKETG